MTEAALRFAKAGGAMTWVVSHHRRHKGALRQLAKGPTRACDCVGPR